MKRRYGRRVAAGLLALLICISHAAAYEDQGPLNQWCLDLIGARVSSEEEEDTRTVRVAVIDSGVRDNDKRLNADQILDGNNYVFADEDTGDRIGHGTAVTSIILGASCGDGELAALTGQVEVVPLVCFSKYPSGVPLNSGVEGICQAVYDAVDLYGCQIINLSLGIAEDVPQLRTAMDYAEEKGIIVISAVGNSNQYAPKQVFYPAAYETVVGVGSVNSSGEVSSFSQRNPSVMVTAPGEKVTAASAYSGTGLRTVSGTSYAAAYVTAYAALILSEDPDMTPAQFRQLLQERSQDKGEPGYDTAYGWGILNAAA